MNTLSYMWYKAGIKPLKFSSEKKFIESLGLMIRCG